VLAQQLRRLGSWATTRASDEPFPSRTTRRTACLPLPSFNYSSAQHLHPSLASSRIHLDLDLLRAHRNIHASHSSPFTTLQHLATVPTPPTQSTAVLPHSPFRKSRSCPPRLKRLRNRLPAAAQAWTLAIPSIVPVLSCPDPTCAVFCSTFCYFHLRVGFALARFLSSSTIKVLYPTNRDPK
jgi:hypothetical protein